MREKLNRVSENFPIVVLLVASLALLISNLTPGSWLSGWDNLHPEFNFALNIKRSFFAVWQEYQGLGLLGGMGHASDLPRQIILWIFSFFIPDQLSRHLYHFAMLFVGALGTYFLLKDIVFESSKDFIKKSASLIGSIFYLFNLATLQMFFVPFEAYSAHFAFLPWLFWGNLYFIKNSTYKNLMILLTVNVLSLTQAYVPTYFLVYLMSLSLIFLFYLKTHFKKILLALTITFAINAFWLLPNLYFVATSVDININAKINQMATENNLLKNKKFGSINNTALMKGFWFDNVEINSERVADYQFKDWINHLRNPLVQIIGYNLFLLSLLGIVFSFLKKERSSLVFLLPLTLSFVVITNNTPVISQIANLFYKIPLFSQVFRFPFTKFSLLMALCLAVFYATSYFFLASKLTNRLFQVILGVFFVLLPLIFLSPVFQGKLFYEKEHAEIPNEYFQVFRFFQNKSPNTRIANFPQQTFWGWNFYNFNYSGSGFVWYGIEQPVLDRAFDPWSNYNENYYWEISYALYSKNTPLFEKVLDKYQINWLLVDGNIINTAPAKGLFIDEIEEMLNSSQKAKLVQIFGKIKIYKVDLETPVENYVFLAKNLPVVSPSYNWTNFDQAYLDNGVYLSNSTTQQLNNSTIYYPFRSLFTGRSQGDLEFQVEDQGGELVFKSQVPEKYKDFNLQIPSEPNAELPTISPDNFMEASYIQPNVFIDGQMIEVRIPKTGGFGSVAFTPWTDPGLKEAENCNQFSQGFVKNEKTVDGYFRLSSLDATNCGAILSLSEFPHNLAYLVTIESRNIKGKSLIFWIENLTNHKADLETSLPKLHNNQQLTIGNSHFIQPPMASDGLGYSLHFDNVSIGQFESVNDLGKITVNPIPFKFLAQLRLVSPKFQKQLTTHERISSVSHPNPSLYEIPRLTINNVKSPILILSQSYHPGWQAYLLDESIPSLLAPIYGEKIKDHVLVNNWENGWSLPQETKEGKIVIFFLPQILEYLGFVLLFLTFAIILLKKK